MSEKNGNAWHAELGMNSSLWWDHQTLLDLADAWLELGDYQEATNLLNEVIRGGDGYQKFKAGLIQSRMDLLRLGLG